MFNDSRGPLSLLGSIALILLLASTFACNRSDNDKVVGGPDTGSSVFSLDPPSGVLASNGTYSEFVKVSWTAVAGADAYTVFRTTSDTVTANDFIASNVKGYEYEDHSADLNVTYYYWVRATNGNQLSQLSGFATGFAARGDAGVVVPKDLDATDGDFDNQIDLLWVCTDPSVTFNIYRNTENFAKTAELIASGITDKTYTDTVDATPATIDPNIDYYYWVTASEGDTEGYFGVEDTGYAAKQDLVIKSVHAPSSAYNGFVAHVPPLTNLRNVEPGAVAPISLAVVCANEGRLEAEDFVIGFYFSLDEIFDPEDDNKIATCEVGSIDAESYIIASGQIKVDKGWSDLYHILAVVDEDDDVEESNEDNNINNHQFIAYEDVSESGIPDLTTTNISVFDIPAPSEATPISGAQAGSYVFMRFAFTNNSKVGIDPGVNISTSIVLSNDLIIDENDKELGYGVVDGSLFYEERETIIFFDFVTVHWSYFIPHLPPGLYYIGMLVDSGNDLEEEDEENNTMSWPFIIDTDVPSSNLWNYEIKLLE